MTSVPTRPAHPVPHAVRAGGDQAPHPHRAVDAGPGPGRDRARRAVRGVQDPRARGAQDPGRHRAGRDEPVQGRHGAHGGRGHGARGLRRAAAARTRGAAARRAARRLPRRRARRARPAPTPRPTPPNAPSPTGSSTAPSTCRAATRCSAGCSTRSATRRPSSPPWPGRPTPPGSGRRPSTGRSCGSPLAGDADGAAARALHAHIASFVAAGLPRASRRTTEGPGMTQRLTFEAQRAALADVVAIPVTPFAEDGTVDQDAHRALLRRLLDGGVQHPHPERQHRRVLRPHPRRAAPGHGVDHRGGRRPRRRSSSASATTCRPPSPPPAHARDARRPDGDGPSARPPVRLAGRLGRLPPRHRRGRSRAGRRPVHPQRRCSPAPRLAELADACPNVIGVKYAVPDAARFAAFARDAGLERFVWVAGLAELYAPSYFAAGATGFTSGLVNVAPAVSLNMLEALRSGDYRGGHEGLGADPPLRGAARRPAVRRQRHRRQGGPGLARPVPPRRTPAEPGAARGASAPRSPP